jgi:hypothetical protein
LSPLPPSPPPHPHPPHNHYFLPLSVPVEEETCATLLCSEIYVKQNKEFKLLYIMQEVSLQQNYVTMDPWILFSPTPPPSLSLSITHTYFRHKIFHIFFVCCVTTVHSFCLQAEGTFMCKRNGEKQNEEISCNKVSVVMSPYSMTSIIYVISFCQVMANDGLPVVWNIVVLCT